MRDIRPWFNLIRHDEPPTPVPAPPVPAPPAPAPVADPAADPPADTADTEKWKALARKHEQRAKDNSDAAEELAKIKASQQTDAEKITARAEAAEKQAVALRDRALKAEIKAAADGFADPADAALFLDLSKYSGDEIDLDAIKVDLAEVLKAKPHLAKASANPDLLQGARGGDPKPVDYATADADTWKAKATELGLKVRTR